MTEPEWVDGIAAMALAAHEQAKADRSWGLVMAYDSAELTFVTLSDGTREVKMTRDAHLDGGDERWIAETQPPGGFVATHVVPAFGWFEKEDVLADVAAVHVAMEQRA